MIRQKLHFHFHHERINPCQTPSNSTVFSPPDRRRSTAPFSTRTPWPGTPTAVSSHSALERPAICADLHQHERLARLAGVQLLARRVVALGTAARHLDRQREDAVDAVSVVPAARLRGVGAGAGMDVMAGVLVGRTRFDGNRLMGSMR